MTETGKPKPWKYETKVLGMGESNNKVHFDWGDDITEPEKALLMKHITSLTKWKARVIEVLDNPPFDAEAEVKDLKAEIKKLKGK